MSEVVGADLHLEAVLGQRLRARHHAGVVHQDVNLLLLQQTEEKRKNIYMYIKQSAKFCEAL